VSPVEVVVAAVPGPRYDAALDLRYRVLRAPLGMTRAQVRFAGEERWLHLVALEAGGAVVGCVSLDLAGDAPGEGRLRQMAVDPRLHRRGVGRALVEALEREAPARGLARITLHARDAVCAFYEAAGYAAFGEPFIEVGLQHRHMAKDLEAHGLHR
jgi:ribosomal protein S18 acetylase RimI-like enzyme